MRKQARIIAVLTAVDQGGWMTSHKFLQYRKNELAFVRTYAKMQNITALRSNVLYAFHGKGVIGENLAGAPVEILPGFRQLYGSGVAFEEIDVELLLQRGYLAAHGSLSNKTLFGGFGKVQILRKRYKIFESVNIQIASPRKTKNPVHRKYGAVSTFWHNYCAAITKRPYENKPSAHILPIKRGCSYAKTV